MMDRMQTPAHTPPILMATPTEPDTHTQVMSFITIKRWRQVLNAEGRVFYREINISSCIYFVSKLQATPRARTHRYLSVGQACLSSQRITNRRASPETRKLQTLSHVARPENHMVHILLVLSTKELFSRLLDLLKQFLKLFYVSHSGTGYFSATKEVGDTTF